MRRVANGDLPIDGAYDNNYGFWIVGAGGYTMAFFDDAGSPDYLEWIVAPDGRLGDDDGWMEEQNSFVNPMDAFLSVEERRRLAEQIVAAVTRSRSR